MAEKNSLAVSKVSTPLGKMLLAANDEGLLLSIFEDSIFEDRASKWHSRIPGLSSALRSSALKKGSALNRAKKPVSKKSAAVLNKAERSIERYFAGKKPAFESIPLAADGTAFQKKVWKALGKIPPGKPLAYGELGKKLGSKGLARAVGSACGKNPLCVIVPCHRVTASNGGLGGFSGGLNKKEFLLAHEEEFFA